MANKLFNLAGMTTATVGLFSPQLSAAIPGYLTFEQAGAQDGDIVTYAISDGSNSEVGKGIYYAAGPTLVRARVYASTNGNQQIALSGASQVFLTIAAEDINTVDGFFTLTPGVSTTIVVDPAITINSKFLGAPTPLTKHASVGGTSYEIIDGAFIVTHPNNTYDDRSFSYVIKLNP